ncbi:metallophosphoesterase [Chryseobacterium scophthalmum]|uniref:metallophosphoesterase n=1 Tax=Chryseobacterium scophthalmum TaxID=59733 RepID=UPI001AEC2348|nr:metallophosphoesterase [Chryseobacterium scophthalmum]
MIRILHLTDLHLNNKTLKDWNDFLKEPFFKKLDEIKKEKKIDLVLFTGDMIDQAGKDFGSVQAGLQTFNEYIITPIINALDLDISRFIICPGNHDINRNADKIFLEEGLKIHLNSIENINSFINSSANDYEGIQRIKEYKKFEFDLYYKISDILHSKFKFSIKLDIDGKSVGISSINSSWRCYGDGDYKNLLVGENQLNDNYLFVKDCDVKIALMHHQLDWLAEIESKTIKSHLSNNYDLIFSGHVHETDVEHVKNLNGTSFRIVSPSGLNNIRQKETEYINGFSIIDYGENIKCHFLKYNKNQKIFVDNTDACDKGIIEFNLDALPALVNTKKISHLLDDEFLEFLNDSGANFTHRGKTLTLNDIYVAPFMEQFNLIEEQERGTSVKSEDILKRIVNKETKHVVILGEENSGKTSFCKQIYKGSLIEDKTISILIKGRDIQKVTTNDIESLIKKEFRKQFKETLDLSKYDLLIIIDDLNNCRLPQKSIKTFVNNLHQLEIRTVITWDEFFTFSELLESKVTTVEIYEILKFGGRKRLELIRKWVDMMEDEFDNDQSKEFQIKELSKIVNSVIGKNLIPSLPVYILTILQANELNTTTNFEQSTFGHYYDVLIKSALGKIIKANAEIEKYYSYLTELSFWLFNNKTIEIDEDDFMKFHKFFADKYRVQLSFRESLNILETSNLIQKSLNLYKFKYKYIYFYFIGKYFSDNIENHNVQNIVTDLSNKLYQTETANIYIFLSHHSKSRFIINQIIERAKELFANELIIGFNTDIKKINESIHETAKKMDFVVDESSEYHSHDAQNEELDIKESIFEQDQTNEQIDSISQVNKAFKTIEILGYIIKNRYASLTGVDKIELVEELYTLGLRSLSFIFSTFLEGEEYIKNEIIDLIKKDPNSALTTREREELAKQFMFNLLYMVSYSIFKRISSSISSKDLEMTFDDVKKKLSESSQSGEKNNAISLIDMAVIFEYSKSFPTKRVSDLAKDFKGNHLAFNILRRLGVNFMRMIPMKEQEQQSASEILNISVNSQRLIVGTSSIKKMK